ncbi:histidine kinase [Pseudomonas asiatica]|uniref:histidine kinase n=1 Tax=Pseudomonas asiatica TaxID=2219225 RepID=UPI002DB7F302|nr:histidine kinase [Pseudomonas asiatica]MEB6591708.1 histidine kinase [Pseudomonas asiatica]
MYQPYVLIHQARPSHQILLHQALNAQGIFDVRISASTADLDACLDTERRPDMLILDHAMPTRAGLALLTRQPQARALLFVGQPTPQRHNLAQEARKKGLWVLAELPWPLSMPRLQHALQTLQVRPRQRIQTVTSAPHAH